MLLQMSIEMPTVPEMAPSSPSTSPRAVTTDNEMNLSSSDWEGMAGTSPPGGDIFAWSEGLRSAREVCATVQVCPARFGLTLKLSYFTYCFVTRRSICCEINSMESQETQ